MKTHTVNVLGNLILFQVGWVLCVWTAAANRPWIGVLVIFGVIAAHVFRAPVPQKASSTTAPAIGLVPSGPAIRP